jgi:hypothetical protein
MPKEHPEIAALCSTPSAMMAHRQSVRSSLGSDLGARLEQPVNLAQRWTPPALPLDPQEASAGEEQPETSARDPKRLVWRSTSGDPINGQHQAAAPWFPDADGAEHVLNLVHSRRRVVGQPVGGVVNASVQLIHL